MKLVIAAGLFVASAFCAGIAWAQSSALSVPRIVLNYVYVSDLAKGEQFYRSAFGLQPGRGSTQTGRTLTFPDGPVIFVTQTQTVPARSDFAIFAVAVPDMDAALARVKSAGGTIAEAPREIDGGTRMAFIKDLDGNRIEVLQMKSMAAR